MRTLGILLSLLLVGGCGVLDQLALSGPGSGTAVQLDPNKVYLGRSIISARRTELDRYACVNGPMLCENHGIHFQCRCPW